MTKIELGGLEWTAGYVTHVYISPYRDGLLMCISALDLPAGLAMHLNEYDDDDETLHATFPNLQEITRKGY